jgi:hypothetical protein
VGILIRHGAGGWDCEILENIRFWLIFGMGIWRSGILRKRFGWRFMIGDSRIFLVLGGLIIFDLSGKYLGLYDISSSVTYYTRDTS